MGKKADISFEVKVDNSGKVKEEVEQQIYNALEIMGGTAERYAALLSPWDTGRLRGSLNHQVVRDEKAVYVGTNVEYAAYQELGTKKMSAANGGRGYLRPAIEEHIPEYKKIVETELRG